MKSKILPNRIKLIFRLISKKKEKRELIGLPKLHTLQKGLYFRSIPKCHL
jgi:hypothetical protein